MRPIRWTLHALRNLIEREIDREEADAAIAQPEHQQLLPPDRRALMRRYHDKVLDQAMLMRVIVEDAQNEVVVVTVHKTSQIDRYLKGLTS